MCGPHGQQHSLDFHARFAMATSSKPLTSRLPFWLCLGCALLPFAAVQLSYLLAASAGTVPWCNPYLDSCTSISATGRSGVASYVFRGAMLPASTLIAGFWWLHWRWLYDNAQSLHTGVGSGRRNAMLTLGLIACVGLILYVTVLGEPGDVWRLQRRVGTILFFSFTFLAQLLLAAQLLGVTSDAGGDNRARSTGTWMLRICLVMLCVGVFSVIIQAISEDWHDAIEDAIEWQLALLLQANFLFCTRLWWRNNWELAFRRGNREID